MAWRLEILGKTRIIKTDICSSNSYMKSDSSLNWTPHQRKTVGIRAAWRSLWQLCGGNYSVPQFLQAEKTVRIKSLVKMDFAMKQTKGIFQATNDKEKLSGEVTTLLLSLCVTHFNKHLLVEPSDQAILLLCRIYIYIYIYWSLLKSMPNTWFVNIRISRKWNWRCWLPKMSLFRLLHVEDY